MANDAFSSSTSNETEKQSKKFTFQTLYGIFDAESGDEETIQETIRRVLLSHNFDIESPKYILCHQPDESRAHYWTVILDKQSYIAKQIDDLYESRSNPNAFTDASLKYYLNGLCCFRDPEAIAIVEKYVDRLSKEDWETLSSNHEAIKLLERHPDKISLRHLCQNRAGADLLRPHVPELDEWFWQTFMYNNEGMISHIEENFDQLYTRGIITPRCWQILSENSSAIHILEKNLDKVDWDYFSGNPNAIPTLRRHINKINWDSLSTNRSKDAVPLMLENLDKLTERCWTRLSDEKGINHILEKNIDKLNFLVLSQNEDAFSIFRNNLDKIKLDYRHWVNISRNKGAISFIEENLDKIEWYVLDSNDAAIPLLEKNFEKVPWYNLFSTNNKDMIPFIMKHFDLGISSVREDCWSRISRNELLIEIIEKHIDKINWYSITQNAKAIHILGTMIDFIVSKENIPDYTDRTIPTKKRKRKI